MSRRLEQDIPGYIKGNSLVRKISLDATRIGTKRIYSKESRDNLQQAVTLWYEGHEAWVAAKHESDIDGPLARISIAEGGYPELSESLLILMGDKILDKPIKGLVASSYPHVVVPQAGTQNGRRRELLKTSKEAIPSLLEKGMVGFVFPEGTRSSDGNLGEATPIIAHYIGDDAFVLPMVMEGAKEIWSKKELLPRIGKEVVVHFGRPILIRSVIEQIDVFERSTGQCVNKKQKNQIIVETIMRQGIAPMVHEDKRGPYKNLSFDIATIINSYAEATNLAV